MEIQLREVLNRELKDYKLKEVSKATGIPMSLLSDWQNGSLPSGKNMNHLYILAEFFDLTLEELLFNIRQSKSKTEVLQSTHFRA